jgi:phosphohistidine swiveling domain-containing protein
MMFTKSKGKTLLFLKKRINVPDLILVNSIFFLKNKELIIKKIIKKFKNKKIAIRSSSVNEDTLKTTNAGKYKSFLNVSSNNKSEVIYKISEVIKSYKKNDENNEVIIQKMLTNVKISGVCTTIDIHNYLPITTINYYKGNNTEIITSGKENSFSISIADKKYLSKKNSFYSLLIEVEKLKKILQTNLLDIEFAIDNKNKLYILQVRNLVLNKKDTIVSKKFYFQNLKRLEKKIKKLKEKNYDLFGSTNYFGVMPDWNPAEIIGTKPRPLAVSIYKELITDHIWSKQRNNYGYKDVESHHLLTNFFGTPFVDVRIDFNSWLPKQLNPRLSEKIINFYLSRFKKNKNYHDKIEFKILFTCFTPNTNTRIKNELKNKLNQKEILELKNTLKNVTQTSFDQYKKDSKKIEKLEKTICRISESKNDNISKIYYLIEECKKNGTVAFAGLARCGFIALDILNSLVDNKILSISEKEKFLNSIKNIATKVNNDFIKLSKKQFCIENGHLRPNTYDITTLNYEEGYKIYFNNKNNFKDTNIKFSFSKKQKEYLQNFLKQNRFKFNSNQLINFIKDSIYSREYSKFIFTKCIDHVFKNLINFGKKYGISRDDLSYLDINSVLNFHDNLDSISIINDLKNTIKKKKNVYNNNTSMHLPEVITSIKDIYVYEKNILGGNFITQKIINGEIFELKDPTNINKIENKILLIESADPGFDFIFSKNIKGLITKFGGQNSHMSIRSSELALPAAIGVGEEIYNFLKNKKHIKLDCLNRKIY